MRRSAMASAWVLCFGACLATTELPSTGTTSSAGGEGSSTGGGPTSSGGSNGTGGSGTGLTAADWSSAMIAVYRFEDASNPGLDSSGNELHLTPTRSPPSTQSDERKEGLAALATSFEPHTALTSNASAFQSPPGTNLSWGAWLHAVAHPDAADYMEAIARTGGSGYAVSRHITGALNCSVGDGTWHNVTTPGNAFPLGTWIHAACVFDNLSAEVSLFMDGAPLVVGDVLDIANGYRPLGIPTDAAGSGFEGFIDEAFVYAGVLSEAAVRRIYACGVDGARCQCDEASPAEYAHCGDAHPICATLTPCNQPSPE